MVIALPMILEPRWIVEGGTAFLAYTGLLSGVITNVIVHTELGSTDES